MNARTYLCRAAARITEQSLSKIRSLDDWQRERSERKKRHQDQLGLSAPVAAPRTPLNVRITGTVERDGYRIEKLYYESLPRLYVTANLYLPAGLKEPAPAVLYFCGHSRLQKADREFQAHGRKFCRLGFVTLLVDTVQYGEIKGDHHGCYAKGRFQWYSRGYTPAGVECWNGIRALDLLAARPEVDAERMGITGISGGGGMSWRLGAADERVKVAAPVCGTGTIRSHLAERTLDGHCDCMFHINTAGWDLADEGALIAPRPLLVSAAREDPLYKIESVRETVEKVARIYRLLGAEENIRLVETPGPHAYHETSRTAIFSLFLKHLAGRDVPAAEVGDVDTEKGEDCETLRVYLDGPPPDERVTTIDEDFVPTAKPCGLRTKTELKERREEVIRRLKETAFRHFPEKEPPLDIQINQRLDWGDAGGFRFSFAADDGRRIPAVFRCAHNLKRPAGVLVVLRGPREGRFAAESFVREAESRRAVCFVDVFGVGEQSWGDELSWHVRRATAITGRTVASVRTYDVLRALSAVRTFEETAPEQTAVVARGEMVPPALYAALLDGKTRTVVVGNPPATLNAPSRADGTGPNMEILSCLRTTDLPETAALLWPTELIFIGGRPHEYRFTEEVYRNLGLPGTTRRLQSPQMWS